MSNESNRLKNRSEFYKKAKALSVPSIVFGSAQTVVALLLITLFQPVSFMFSFYLFGFFIIAIAMPPHRSSAKSVTGLLIRTLFSAFVSQVLLFIYFDLTSSAKWIEENFIYVYVLLFVWHNFTYFTDEGWKWLHAKLK